MTNITFISASAGSGKTHRITTEITALLSSGACRPRGLIATTYTKKAAAELRERLRQKLFQAGKVELAESLNQSMMGTVHSVCGQILERFAFEAGISPRVEILDEDVADALLAQAVEMAGDLPAIEQLQELADRLGQRDSKASQYAWKGQVREIINAARTNDIGVDLLPTLAVSSVESLLAFLPEPAAEDLDALLLEAIDTASEQISSNGDDTKGTQDYLREIESAKRQLSDSTMPWSRWVALSKSKPTKASEAQAIPVVNVASRVESHPRLRKDIREYTVAVFALAAKSLAMFQQLKEERGLLDYTDLEQRTVHLVRDNASVREVLQQELELLVVDEFQDTSPIQLALFIQLAGCARKTIWVGDVKQAIYGFRNSDPDLLRAVVEGIRSGGGTIAPPLDQSWRSTPELVRLANELFAPAFGKSLALPADEVRLKPVPDRLSPPQAAVEFLKLSSGSYTKDKKNPKLKQLTNDLFAETLAEGVAGLVNREPICQVLNKRTGKLRTVELRDVAVLCRSNPVAGNIAAALGSRGLAVTLAAKGLLATPEACLVLACLRRLADPADSLSAAEIVALTGTLKPEEWLESRLTYLGEREKRSAQSDRWGLEEPFLHPALVAIEKERATLDSTSPTEALDLAMLAADVWGAVSAWGPTVFRAEQRRANLEALRSLATKYEQACVTTHAPATLAGFLFWLEDLEKAKDDKKAADEQSNAIYVGTYHSAKGLEWPVVVCADLDEEPRPRLWSVNAVLSDADQKFDVNQPLVGRAIRFWAWPFGQQEKGIPLSTNIEASQLGQAALRTAQQEELRLLYVGLTRARDLLVLAWDIAKPTPWLDSLEAAWLRPDKDKVILPDGTSIPACEMTLTPPSAIEAQTPASRYLWFPSAADRSVKLPARLTPSAQSPHSSARVGQVIDLGKRLPLAGQPDEADMGDALHAILAAELINPNHPGRRVMAEDILRGHGLENAIKPDDALYMADVFRTRIGTLFNIRRLLVETPFFGTNALGQRITGIIDLAIETDQGWIVIDHKSYPGKRTDWEARALSFSGQLSLYAVALAEAKGAAIRTWIHFAVGGGLVEVVLPAAKAP